MERVERLLYAHQRSDPGLPAAVERLSADERAAAVGALSLHQTPHSLLRFLLSHRSTRLSAAREALRLLLEGRLRGRSALFCISELRIALMTIWNGGEQVKIRSPALFAAWKEQAQPEETEVVDGLDAVTRFTELRLLAADVLRQLLPPKSAEERAAPEARAGSPSESISTAPPSSSDVDGLASALELLPPLLYAADTAEAQLSSRGSASGTTAEPADMWPWSGVPDAPFSERVLHALLRCPWPYRLLSTIVEIYEGCHTLRKPTEARLRSRIGEVLCGRLDGYVGASSGGAAAPELQPQLLGLAKQLLAFVESGRSADCELLKVADAAAGGPEGGVDAAPDGSDGSSASQGALPMPVRRCLNGTNPATMAAGAFGQAVPQPTWCSLLLSLATVLDEHLLPEFVWLTESTLRHSARLRDVFARQMELEALQLGRAVRAFDAATRGCDQRAATAPWTSPEATFQHGERAASEGSLEGHVSLPFSIAKLIESGFSVVDAELWARDCHHWCVRRALVNVLLLELDDAPPTSRTCRLWTLLHSMAAACAAAEVARSGASTASDTPSTSSGGTSRDLGHRASYLADVNAPTCEIVSAVGTSRVHAGSLRVVADPQDAWDHLRRLLSRLAAQPALGPRAELLLLLGLSHAEQGRNSRIRQDPRLLASNVARRTGVAALTPMPAEDVPPFYLLLQLFSHLPSAREPILCAAFDALRREDSCASGRRRAHLWSAMLSCISRSHLMALHAHAERMAEWSGCLPSLHPAHASRVLSSLLPLVPLHASFGRRLLIFLRKLLGSPEPNGRSLAVDAWCELLGTGLLSSTGGRVCTSGLITAPHSLGEASAVSEAPVSESDAEADAVLALRWAAGLSTASRQQVLARLPRLLVRGSPLSERSRERLLNMLAEHLMAAGSVGRTTGDSSAGGASTGMTPSSRSDGDRSDLGTCGSLFDTAWAARFFLAARTSAGSPSALIFPLLVRCMHVVVHGSQQLPCTTESGIVAAGTASPHRLPVSTRPCSERQHQFRGALRMLRLSSEPLSGATSYDAPRQAPRPSQMETAEKSATSYHHTCYVAEVAQARDVSIKPSCSQTAHGAPSAARGCPNRDPLADLEASILLHLALEEPQLCLCAASWPADDSSLLESVLPLLNKAEVTLAYCSPANNIGDNGQPRERGTGRERVCVDAACGKALSFMSSSGGSLAGSFENLHVAQSAESTQPLPMSASLALIASTATLIDRACARDTDCEDESECRRRERVLLADGPQPTTTSKRSFPGGFPRPSTSRLGAGLLLCSYAMRSLALHLAAVAETREYALTSMYMRDVDAPACVSGGLFRELGPKANACGDCSGSAGLTSGRSRSGAALNVDGEIGGREETDRASERSSAGSSRNSSGETFDDVGLDSTASGSLASLIAVSVRLHSSALCLAAAIDEPMSAARRFLKEGFAAQHEWQPSLGDLDGALDRLRAAALRVLCVAVPQLAVPSVDLALSSSSLRAGAAQLAFSQGNARQVMSNGHESYAWTLPRCLLPTTSRGEGTALAASGGHASTIAEAHDESSTRAINDGKCASGSIGPFQIQSEEPAVQEDMGDISLLTVFDLVLGGFEIDFARGLSIGVLDSYLKLLSILLGLMPHASKQGVASHQTCPLATSEYAPPHGPAVHGAEAETLHLSTPKRCRATIAAGVVRRILEEYTITQPSALRPLLRFLFTHAAAAQGGGSTPLVIEVTRSALVALIPIEAAACDAENAARCPSPKLKLSGSAGARTGALLETLEYVRRSAPQATFMADWQSAESALQLRSYFTLLSGVVCAVFSADLSGNPHVTNIDEAVDNDQLEAEARGREASDRQLLSPNVVAKILLLINGSLALAVRVCTRLHRAPGLPAASANNETRQKGHAEGSVARAWIPTWQAISPLLVSYGEWVRARRSTWPTSCRKRVPTALYALERLQLLVMECARAALRDGCIVDSHNDGALADSVGPRGHENDGGENGLGECADTASERPACTASEIRRLLDDLEGAWQAGVGHRSKVRHQGQSDNVARDLGCRVESDVDLTSKTNLDDEMRIPQIGRGRRRLRSRNAYIDAELGTGGYGADTYADLEDFIVVKKGRRY